ncbi:MAG: hypothetical protein JST23_10405 [Bacteroidetes bacterium]|nr:hypothetical protein [Bacteroidota bacterium]
MVFKYAISILSLTLFFFSCKKNSSNPINTNTDSFLVSVVNGYGSGKYKVGDTVNIFSTAYSSTQTFGSWTGTDIGLLNNSSGEWHTWFIMPAKDEVFTSNIINCTPFTLNYEQIKGETRLKPVYYYFPANHKGIVYLLHGTSGSAFYLVSGYEWQLMINDLVNNNYAVIITESEESTTNTDLNGDGKIRWNTTPIDTIANVDYANIRIIADTFYNRGVTNRSKPLFSIGMSNGGNFSAALSMIYKYKAGVSYCAPSGNYVAQNTSTPLLFCMAKFDNNPEVGATGNNNALSNVQTINGRGICAKYLIRERAPLYPERFARRGDISLGLSSNIFNELKANRFLDAKNYFIGYSEDFQSALNANPTMFPISVSLSPMQLAFVREQISLSVSDHQMYSDFNKATIRFLNNQCQ